MMIIGVTGPIGSGKSTVSKILAKKGAQLIDADLVYKEVVSKGKPALEEIVSFFGHEIVDADGQLDRKKLAGIVFEDEGKLDQLNAITHKYVVEKIKEEINASLNKRISSIIVECPIPVEHGFLDTVDKVYVVVADIYVRVERIMKRNSLTYQEAMKRIDAQMSEEEYIRIADYIIRNDSDLETLEKQLENITI
ncbi:MAG: dephospho-CoA kinase [Bacillota bacterium]|nr:dephospho-CoA kinase [Bacillota bacterium]